MSINLLEDLKGNGEDDRADHHSDSENEVFRVVDGGVSDISPRKLLDIRRTLGDCDIVGPHDAAESDDKAEEGKGAALKAVVALLASV